MDQKQSKQSQLGQFAIENAVSTVIDLHLFNVMPPNSSDLYHFRFEKVSSTPNWAKLPSERHKQSDGKIHQIPSVYREMGLDKYCRSRSDCSSRNTLIRVYTVCHSICVQWFQIKSS